MAGLLLCIVAAFMALGFAEVGTVTDVCAKCRGVWFDRHEIAAVWTLALATALQGKLSTAGEVVRGTGEVAVHALDGLSTGVEAGGMILEGAASSAGAVADALASVPEAAGVVAEAAGDVFEALLSIAAAVLEGLSV